MLSFLFDTIAGIVAAIIFASLTALIIFLRKKIREGKGIFPIKSKQREKEIYSHLNGSWLQHYLSYLDKSTPCWLEGNQEVEVYDKFIQGTTTLSEHPRGPHRFALHGEIRDGKLIIIDSSTQDSSEFASIIFPDLRSREVLIGIWVGFDNNRNLIAAPVIWSKNPMEVDEMNKLIKSSPMNLVTTGINYNLWKK